MPLIRQKLYNDDRYKLIVSCREIQKSVLTDIRVLCVIYCTDIIECFRNEYIQNISVAHC